jgi:predicted lipoprotein
MAGSSNRAQPRLLRFAALLVGGGIFFWLVPLFHVRRVSTPSTETPGAAAGSFNPKASAETFWRERLTPAARQAADLVQALRTNPESAKRTFGKSVGVGADYFFVRGTGKVVARERNVLHIAVEGAPNEVVALRIGPVFGNIVRDGNGLLDVNSFPGLQEFNALSAELNALVEKEILPGLRDKANVGASVYFAGCAEAPESASDAGEPLFTVVPVQAEVR